MTNPFKPSDRVLRMGAPLVLTVIATDGDVVTVEAHGLTTRHHQSLLSLYNPRPLPKMQPLDINVAEMSAVDLLEWSKDGWISPAECQAAFAEDARRRKQRETDAALGAALSVAAE